MMDCIHGATRVTVFRARELGTGRRLLLDANPVAVELGARFFVIVDKGGEGDAVVTVLPEEAGLTTAYQEHSCAPLLVGGVPRRGSRVVAEPPEGEGKLVGVAWAWGDGR